LTTKKVHKLLESDYFWKRKTRHDFGCFKNADGTPLFPGVFKEDLYSFNNSWKEFYFGIQRFLDIIFNENSHRPHEFPGDSSKWQKHFYGISSYLVFEPHNRKFQESCKVMKYLIELGIDVNQHGSPDHKPIVASLISYMVDEDRYNEILPIVKLCIKAGADVDKNDSFTFSSLYNAAFCYKPNEMVEILMAAGAKMII
jgi:hypothetical protein